MIHQYLIGNKYKLYATGKEINSPFSIYALRPDAAECDLCVPASEEFADYEHRIVELLDNLAIIEDRDSYSVWKDIERCR